MNASTAIRPLRSLAAMIASASSTVIAIGFSQRTCLPASSARTVHSAWRPFGRAMYTAWTSGSARRSSYAPWTTAAPCRLANDWPRWASRLATAWSRPRGLSTSARAIRGAILPGPRIPQPSLLSVAEPAIVIVLPLHPPRTPPRAAIYTAVALQRGHGRWYSRRRKDLSKRITNPVTVGRDDVGFRSESVRRANLSAIVRALHDRGPLSRSALVTSTGLTRSAI